MAQIGRSADKEEGQTFLWPTPDCGEIHAMSYCSDRPLPLVDGPDLAAALEEANINTLLMVYVHLTRDRELLEQFAQHIRPVFARDPTDIPAGLAQELRSKLRAVLTAPVPQHTDDLPRDLMKRMMEVGVGEPVEDEFLPLLFDQIGFHLPPERRTLPGRKVPPSCFKVLVIGAGMVGLLASYKLTQAGYDHVVIEKNPDVGGTWYENRYPGVGVDTPSHFYSFSFEISPDWDYYHPRGGDMQAYLTGVADKHDLRRNIRFESRVTRLRYDERDALWEVTVIGKDGSSETLRVNAVINAHGPVNRWSWPDIPGLADFDGPKMHTAAWDRNVSLAGKRVAVIGTGASAAQLVPAIAPEVHQLTVFMRSRHWVINNPEILNKVEPGMKWALTHIPHFKEWFRFRVYWNGSDGLFVNVLKDPGWRDAHSVSRHNAALRRFSLRHMEAKFADRPDLLEKLTPDYPIFGKRVIMDGGWFDALKRDNVRLEDGEIDSILPQSIRMKDGTEHPVDVIICATGFDVARMIGSLEVIGREGRNLGKEWGKDDPRAYLGVCVPGYPNFFMTVGPNSAPNHAAGHNLIGEAQINYIVECLDAMVQRDAVSFEVAEAPYIEWNDKVDARMQDMIWTDPRVHSYYKNSKGRVFLSWPWRLVDYWNHMRGPVIGHFILRQCTDDVQHTAGELSA